MVARILAAGVAGLLLASPAAALDIMSGAVAMSVAREVCPVGTVSEERLASALQLAEEETGLSTEDVIFRVVARALAAQKRLIENGQIDPFCEDIRALAPPVGGN